MTAVERINDYSHLPLENSVATSTDLPLDWPQSGRLEFCNVSLKYQGNDYYSLQNVSTIFQDKVKVIHKFSYLLQYL